MSTLLPGSHGLKLIDALLGVALADLAQGFVLVPAGPDVLGMQHVVLRFLGFVPGLGQLRTQSLGGGGRQTDERSLKHSSTVYDLAATGPRGDQGCIIF